MRFYILHKNSRWPPKIAGKRLLGTLTSTLCSYPVGQKFIEIALSHTISKINAFVHFTQKFKMAAKNGRKDFWKKSLVHSAYTLYIKNFVEIALSHIVSEINAFLHFTQKFKMAARNGGKTFWE